VQAAQLNLKMQHERSVRVGRQSCNNKVK